MDTNKLSSKNNHPATMLPSGSPLHSIKDLKALQSEIPLTSDDLAKDPEPELFPDCVSCTILEPEIDRLPEHCVILLHDKGQQEKSLKDLARRLRFRLPKIVFLLLRGPTRLSGSEPRYQWACSVNEVDDGFFKSCRHILNDVILDCLIKKCHFQPRNIVVIGHGQGSLVGLRAVTIWNEIEFGGVIAVGGPLPTDLQLLGPVKARTPVLVIQALNQQIEPQSMEKINGIFPFVDLGKRPGGDEDPPRGLTGSADQMDELKPYMDFLVHRLERDEWRKQDIISFGRKID